MTISSLLLKKYVADEQSGAASPDALWQEFATQTNALPFLKSHRDYTENHQLGLGDRAFHYLWFLLLLDLAERVGNPRLLEIGVYKGQVISLWALIASQLHLKAEVSAISPLTGNYRHFRLPAANALRARLSPSHRQLVSSGNAYPLADYEVIIQKLFRHFELDYHRILLHKNYSTDAVLLEKLEDETYDLIYIDGDHSFEGASGDIRNFAPKVTTTGFW